MLNSKGQGLSLNTIIIAIIVLVVLVVLVLIFTGYFGVFTDEITANTCAEYGGQCVTAEDGGCPASDFGGERAHFTNGDEDCKQGGAQRICCSIS